MLCISSWYPLSTVILVNPSKHVKTRAVLIFAVGVECGENRGRTGGEPGENRGRPKEPGENRGHLGREPGENRGRSGGFGTRTGGRNFLWNKRPNSGPENQRTGPPVKISIGLIEAMQRTNIEVPRKGSPTCAVDNAKECAKPRVHRLIIANLKRSNYHWPQIKTRISHQIHSEESTLGNHNTSWLIKKVSCGGCFTQQHWNPHWAVITQVDW